MTNPIQTPEVITARSMNEQAEAVLERAQRLTDEIRVDLIRKLLSHAFPEHGSVTFVENWDDTSPTVHRLLSSDEQSRLDVRDPNGDTCEALSPTQTTTLVEVERILSKIKKSSLEILADNHQGDSKHEEFELWLSPAQTTIETKDGDND